MAAHQVEINFLKDERQLLGYVGISTRRHIAMEYLKAFTPHCEVFFTLWTLCRSDDIVQIGMISVDLWSGRISRGRSSGL